MLALALVLTACVSTRPTAVAFRPANAPIWSAAAFSPMQISGSWQQVAGFSAKPGGCKAGRIDFLPVAGGMSVSGMLCLNGVAERVSGLATAAGPGRLSVAGQEDWWVLWVDSGYRTLAIGTPSGRFGFILDRSALPPDRFAAAREVFDFNGYVTSALRPF
jgi:apolipoprotein D and lipocalin family protein